MKRASTLGLALCGLLLAPGCRSSSPQPARPAARAATPTPAAPAQAAAATTTGAGEPPAAPTPEAVPVAPPAPPEMGCQSPCGTDSECLVAPGPDCGDCVAVTIASAPTERCAARSCRATICDPAAHRARCDLTTHHCVLAPAS